MFLAALFTIAKLWKQPRCPTTNEWIKKMWYTHTHTHTKWSFGKWMQFKGMMLSEVIQVRKTKATYFLSCVEDRSKR
jgi:hypothetical protein